MHIEILTPTKENFHQNYNARIAKLQVDRLSATGNERAIIEMQLEAAFKAFML